MGSIFPRAQCEQSPEGSAVGEAGSGGSACKERIGIESLMGKIRLALAGCSVVGALALLLKG